LVQSVDYFYPLVDDPFLMGKISFANVASDVYSSGVTEIDDLKIIIQIPEEFSDEERDSIVPAILEGFQDSAKEAACKLTLNSITINPWCVIGGIASSVVPKSQIKFPIYAAAGDLLILTKPLGTRLATNAPFWMASQGENWQLMSAHSLTPQAIEEANEIAVKSMVALNKTAAHLMHKYDSHAATDVTGFGLAGHGENLLSYQAAPLDFIIDSLPIIKNVAKIAESLNRLPRLLGCRMPETSGGLLIALPKENSTNFIDDFKAQTGFDCWVIGHVQKGDRKVVIGENVKVIEATL
jgi:selenide,water dikinase